MKYTVVLHLTNWQTHEGKSTHIKGAKNKRNRCTHSGKQTREQRTRGTGDTQANEDSTRQEGVVQGNKEAGTKEHMANTNKSTSSSTTQT